MKFNNIMSRVEMLIVFFFQFTNALFALAFPVAAKDCYADDSSIHGLCYYRNTNFSIYILSFNVIQMMMVAIDKERDNVSYSLFFFAWSLVLASLDFMTVIFACEVLFGDNRLEAMIAFGHMCILSRAMVDIDKNMFGLGIEFEKQGRYNEQQCVMCLDDIDSEKCVAIACGHRFHVACITSWLCEAGECPVCRAPVCIYEGVHCRYDRIFWAIIVSVVIEACYSH